jgi:hypothetical protein
LLLNSFNKGKTQFSNSCRILLFSFAVLASAKAFSSITRSISLPREKSPQAVEPLTPQNTMGYLDLTFSKNSKIMRWRSSFFEPIFPPDMITQIFQLEKLYYLEKLRDCQIVKLPIARLKV